MLVKKCPDCKKRSYSASDRGTWICQNCKKDLTDLEAKPAGFYKKKSKYNS